MVDRNLDLDVDLKQEIGRIYRFIHQEKEKFKKLARFKLAIPEERQRLLDSLSMGDSSVKIYTYN